MAGIKMDMGLIVIPLPYVLSCAVMFPAIINNNAAMLRVLTAIAIGKLTARVEVGSMKIFETARATELIF